MGTIITESVLESYYEIDFRQDRNLPFNSELPVPLFSKPRRLWEIGEVDIHPSRAIVIGDPLLGSYRGWYN